MTLSLFALLLSVSLLPGSFSLLKDPDRPWLDTSLPIPERVSALLKTLSTDQLVSQTFASYSDTDVQSLESLGVGAVTYGPRFKGTLRENIEQRNRMQKTFVNQSGIPVSFINEGLHGGAAGGSAPVTLCLCLPLLRCL